ncbi:hypothetical protein [Plastoroseomonas hellenica]|uniref:DUF2207 domain-containing protein n=1 Tax=Plastoroseomonas hellenica TaxID=2687306 RepID=A0ABS5ERU3_9PROT|nr:hypothetical protein [Plastoroseomonas hellenica]MBR0647454.1 hypothetical protein [Plastoroseomonas hellenica]MBR0663021.1 hypothetical protein [Plastoroseomonas hellenica]
MAIWSGLTLRKRLFVLAWASFIILIYLGIGVTAVSVVHGERVSSAAGHRARMTVGAVERGQTPPEPIPEAGDFTNVTIGLYLDGIETLSIRDSFWAPTFYIWFRWQGDRALNPGANFRLVDGSITRRDLQEEYYGADGTNYQRYRVTARMTKFFNTTRVPRDDHMLNLYIEDARFDATRLRYVADPASNVSSRVRVSGYTISRSSEQVAKTHTYRSSYGDPRLEGQGNRTFSMFTYGVRIERSGMGVYFKVFIGLFAGMALAFASFGLRASDAGPRFSMVAGSYFGAVANSYLAGSLIPSSGQFGLVEYVTFIGLFTIFFSLIATIVSIYIWNIRADKELSRAFDVTTVTAAGIGYVAVNILLPLSA